MNISMIAECSPHDVGPYGPRQCMTHTENSCLLMSCLCASNGTPPPSEILSSPAPSSSSPTPEGAAPSDTDTRPPLCRKLQQEETSGVTGDIRKLQQGEIAGVTDSNRNWSQDKAKTSRIPGKWIHPQTEVGDKRMRDSDGDFLLCASDAPEGSRHP